MPSFSSYRFHPATPILLSITFLKAGGTGGIQGALTLLATAGVDVAITELNIAGGSSLDIQKVIQACLAVPKCIGISEWGIKPGGGWTLFPTTTFGPL